MTKSQKMRQKIRGSFPFVPPPSLKGAYYLHPQTQVPYFYIPIYYVMARALLTGGRILYWGEAQTEKIQIRQAKIAVKRPQD